MIQPTEPTYGAFLQFILMGEDEMSALTQVIMLPVICYDRTTEHGSELSPQFLPPGRVQTYDVFDLRDELAASQYFFFLGLLIPGAAVPEAYEEQWKAIILNARTHLDRGRETFQSFTVDETLRAWIGEPDGTE